MEATVPAGYVPSSGPSRFVRNLADFHRREIDGRHWVGCRIGPDQANTEGFAHGGFIAAFADFALAETVMGITLSLSIDYLRPARLGDWVEAEVIERKRSASLVFADAMIRCGEIDLIRISGVFRPFVPRASG